MCRAMRWAAGVLLALDVSGLTGSASAQTWTSPSQEPPTPRRIIHYQEPVVAREDLNRLEEMKVQLALLSDVATFPYPVGVHASGGKLSLIGSVPDTMVKQAALELAGKSTSLKVTDGLKIQSNLNVKPSPRGVEFLQIEGKALLGKNRGEARHPLHLSAQPNGMVAVTGSVYSVEEKLAVSQLFRKLDGCTGVLNQLTVLPVLRDGQRVVRVTREGTLTVPEAALNAEAGTVSAARKTPAVLPPPRPTLTPAPKVDIKEEELHLPVIVTPKTNHGPNATPTGNGRGASPVIQATPVSQTKPSAPPAGENKSASVDILAAPKVPASWSRGVITWDTDSPSKSTTLPAPKPAAKESRGVISWESEPPPKPQSSPAVKPPATSSKGVIVWESEPPKSPTPSAASTPASTTVRRTPPMRWESETQTKPTAIAPTPPPAAAPRTPPVAQLPPPQPTVKPQTRPVTQPSTPPRTAAAIQAPAVPPVPAPRPTNANRETRVVRTSNNPATASEKPALVSPRRWPPAFDIRPPVSEWGQAGSMTFEEEQEPPARPAPRPVARRLEPTDFVPSEPLAPKLAPPEPLIPTPPPQAPFRTPPPSTPVPHQAPTHSRTAWSAWPVSPTDLKQRVESMCGRLAKEVQVQTQRDGSVLVKVKLVNAAAERQLTNKILTIPEITSPNVHLEMVIGN